MVRVKRYGLKKAVVTGGEKGGENVGGRKGGEWGEKVGGREKVRGIHD